MIEITKTKKHGVCGSCCSQEDIFDIKVSTTGEGWTTIMLCKECRDTLACKLLTFTLQDLDKARF